MLYHEAARWSGVDEKSWLDEVGGLAGYVDADPRPEVSERVVYGLFGD